MMWILTLLMLRMKLISRMKTPGPLAALGPDVAGKQSVAAENASARRCAHMLAVVILLQLRLSESARSFRLRLPVSASHQAC
mmetsp:Transcript_29036/g.49519  ORF Transcript_29036/g.49519 Transcript_29036/m.49519 type:complete len:82 (-) Transcript_29036:95-340(-)